MVTEKRDFPGWKTRQAHVDAIVLNWNLLARESYKHFLAHGAGVLVLDESDFTGKSKGRKGEITVAYVPKEIPITPTFFEEKEIRWMEEYDPTTTLLCVFLRGDEGVSSYRMTAIDPDRTPKAIFEREAHDNQTDPDKPKTQPG